MVTFNEINSLNLTQETVKVSDEEFYEIQKYDIRNDGDKRIVLNINELNQATATITKLLVRNVDIFGSTINENEFLVIEDLHIG